MNMQAIRSHSPPGISVGIAFALFFYAPGWISFFIGVSNGFGQNLDLAWLRYLDVFWPMAALFAYSCFIERTTSARIWEVEPSNSKRCLEAWGLGMRTCLIAWPLGVGVKLLVGSAVRSFTSEPLVEQMSIQFLREISSSPIRIVVDCVGSVGCGPIAEEILFRGFLQNWLREQWGKNTAIYGASIVFALFHYSSAYGFTNVELLVALFVGSVIKCILYERTRSLWAPIALHMTHNGLTTLAVLLTK